MLCFGIHGTSQHLKAKQVTCTLYFYSHTAANVCCSVLKSHKNKLKEITLHPHSPLSFSSCIEMQITEEYTKMQDIGYLQTWKMI